MSEAFAAAAKEEIRVAGEEETRLAIERGDVIDSAYICNNRWLDETILSQ